MLGLFAAVAIAAASPPPLSRDEVAACLGTSDFSLNMPRLAVERAEVGADDWTTACREARQANASRRSLIARIFESGEPPPGAYPATARFARLALSASDPEVRDLFSGVARDQAARESLSAAQRAHFAPHASALTVSLLNGLIANEAVRADADNRARLAPMIRANRWFTISRYGPDADSAAWLIAQHADSDRVFQKAVIDLLTPLAERGETSPIRLAYLYERWARAAGAASRYGVFGACVGPGEWKPATTEDLTVIDTRRKSAGMEPLAADIERESKACR